jgi:hypothetical protein
MYIIYYCVKLSFDDAQPCAALLIVDAGAYGLASSSHLPTPRRLNNTLLTPQKQHFTLLGDTVSSLKLLLLSGAVSLVFFFVVLYNSRQLISAAKNQHLAAITTHLHDR